MKKLSFQSQQLLTLKFEHQQKQFLEYILSTNKKNIELANIQILCLAKIPRYAAQNNAVDVIIVGTENSSIYFIDSQAYTVLRHVTISGVPVKFLTIGIINFYVFKF